MTKPIAILSAMDQEIRAIEQRLENSTVTEILDQRFTTGTFNGVELVTAISGYGKVGAAATTAIALHAFDARAAIFAGVAGGIRPDVNIGDIVVADRLIQHDLDVSPLFARYVVPSLGTAEIRTDPELTAELSDAAHRYITGRAAAEITDIPGERFDPSNMQIHLGLVASGDRFINDLAEAASLQGALPDVLAVEMEGAAFAQVCAERQVPFAVYRSISDRSDRDAEVDFIAFVSSVASPLTAGIIDEWTAAAG